MELKGRQNFSRRDALPKPIEKEEKKISKKEKEDK